MDTIMALAALQKSETGKNTGTGKNMPYNLASGSGGSRPALWYSFLTNVPR